MNKMTLRGVNGDGEGGGDEIELNRFLLPYIKPLKNDDFFPSSSTQAQMVVLLSICKVSDAFLCDSKDGEAPNCGISDAHPNIIQAFQAVAAAGGSSKSSASASAAASLKKSLNAAAIMGEAFPRGRGVDERAARATAEVRKKAVARGLLIRPHGVPVQAFPPLIPLHDIINSVALL